MSAHRVDQGMAAAAARLLPQQVTPELRTRYRQLRVMLRTAGLAPTYAFVASKAGAEQGPLVTAYSQAADGMRERLAEAGLLGGDPQRVSHRQMLSRLGELTAADYARASAEVEALTGWLSRLADAAHEPGGGDESGSEPTS